MRGHPIKSTVAVREAQLELFHVEAALTEFERKRKELKARLVLLGAGTKVCTKCHEDLDIEQFHRDKHKTDKKCSWCNECRTKDVLARYYKNKRAA
jgi:hypothetical protein